MTNKLTINYFDGDKHEATYKLDPKQNPRTIDLTFSNFPFQGMTFLGIYELDGDKLKVAYSKAEGRRPGDFQSPTKERGDISFVLQRKKPETAEGKKDLIQPGDCLLIRAPDVLPNQPINGVFRVEPGGTVALGPFYGRVPIAGQTLKQAETTIRDRLKKLGLTRYQSELEVSVTRTDLLPEEVRNLRTTVEGLQKQKGK
jgi:hypothetical protein